MKKFVGILLILALLCAMSVPAFAETQSTANTISTIGGTSSAAVKGSYASGSSSATVYHVDITWGSMEFTYNAGSQGSWNPATHKYDDVVEPSWSCDGNANVITVTNHSNAAVKATCSYTAAEGFTGITGSFTENGVISLATAVGTEVKNAPTGSVNLTLDGALAANTAEKTTIGTVTVTLAGN